MTGRWVNVETPVKVGKVGKVADRRRGGHRIRKAGGHRIRLRLLRKEVGHKKAEHRMLLMRKEQRQSNMVQLDLGSFIFEE